MCSRLALQFYLALARGLTVKAAFRQGRAAVLVTPNLEDAEEETEKFLLLPENGDHDVPIFDAPEIREWLPAMRSSELSVYNKIQRRLSHGCTTPKPFLGRDIDMYHILNLIMGEKSIVSLIGEPGSGTSGLSHAVCHYINERRSIFYKRIDSILITKAPSSGELPRFLDVLRGLQMQLNDDSSTIICGDDDNMDSLMHSVCETVSEKALLVIDDVDYEKGSDDQKDLFVFLGELQRRGIKVLLIGREAMYSPRLHEQPYAIGPLGFYDTVELFSNFCPLLQSPGVERRFREKIASAFEKWQRKYDKERFESLYFDIYQRIGKGIPHQIENAAFSLSQTEIDGLGTDPFEYSQPSSSRGVDLSVYTANND